MNQQLGVIIPEIILVLFLTVAFVVLMGANIYDIKQAVRRKSLRKTWQKFLWSKKPSISIIVYAKDSAGTIESCLDGIRKSRYPHFDIVVADNSSDDDTRVTVRSYIQKYPKLPIRLYSKRQRGDRAQVIYQSYRRSQKGDLVLVIDASNSISDLFLRDSAARFVYDDELQVLRYNVRGLGSDSITLLFYRFQQLSRSLMAKFYGLLSKYRADSSLDVGMYRQGAFVKAVKKSGVCGQYDSGLVVSDYSVMDDKTAIVRQFAKGGTSFYHLAFAGFSILLQTYSMYLAATLQSKMLLTVGWLAVALWLLLATWSSEVLSTKDKITIAVCAPFMYFLIYLQLVSYVIFITLVGAISILKQVAHSLIIGAMAR
jgi:glycosyltransferase involved in cell wall biosynthesis